MDERTNVDKSLYTLFRQLANEVPRDDDRASLIGYIILDGLIYFSSLSGSAEERTFQEVRAVYTGLELAIAHCSQDAPDESALAYTFLCGLIARADPLLQRYFSNPVTNVMGSSRLLSSLLEELFQRPQSYEDRLRRRSLTLMDAVRSRGIIDGRRNILLSDYALLQFHFVGGGGRS